MYCFLNDSTVLTNNPETAKYWFRTGRVVAGLAYDAEHEKEFRQVMEEDSHREYLDLDFRIITPDEFAAMVRR